VYAPRKLINGSLRPAGGSVEIQEVTGMDNTLRLDLFQEGANIGNCARMVLGNVRIGDKDYGIRASGIVLQLRSFKKVDQTGGLIVGDFVIGDFLAMLIEDGYRLAIARADKAQLVTSDCKRFLAFVSH
jgi:hypothetical protein